MKRVADIAALMLFGLMLVACDARKQPAQAAYAQVEASVAPVRESLEKYAPEQYEQLNALMDQMRSRLNDGDYEGALAFKPQVMARLAAASSAAGQKKNELVRSLSADWKVFSANMPHAIELLTTRVNELLAPGHKLPANITRDTLIRSQSAVAEISGQWNAAVEAAQHNNLDEAVTKSKAIKKHCLELSTALNVKLGDL